MAMFFDALIVPHFSADTKNLRKLKIQQLYYVIYYGWLSRLKGQN